MPMSLWKTAAPTAIPKYPKLHRLRQKRTKEIRKRSYGTSAPRCYVNYLGLVSFAVFLKCAIVISLGVQNITKAKTIKQKATKDSTIISTLVI